MDPNNNQFNTQNSSDYPFSYQNPNNYQHPNQFPNQHPRLWDIADLGIIMRPCIILHNMIVEDERDTYAQRWTDFEQSEGSGSSAPQLYSTEVLPTFASHVHARSELRDSNVHHELQADLVKHIWTKFGMFCD